MSDTPRSPEDSTGAQTPDPIVIPSWVSSDWMLATRVAAAGHLLLIVVATVVTVIAILQQIAGFGLDSVAWGPMALSPLLVVLGWAGGGQGEPVLLTGAIYLFVAYLVVCRRSSHLAAVVSDRVRAFAAAAKIGIVAALGLLVLAILIDVLAADLVERGFAPWLGARIDLTSLVFTSVFVGAVAALFALIVAARTTLAALLGLTVRMPPMVRAGLRGARRTVVIGGLGLLVLWAIGTLLDSLTQGSTLGGGLSVVLGTVNRVALAGVDQAILLILGASKFHHAGGFVWAPFVGVASWMWLALPVLIGAYIAGGVTAARAGSPASQAEAARAALLVGPTVAVVSLPVAIGWAGQPFIDDIVPIAVLLPSLWGVIAVGAAWLWANQQGLPSGLVIERADEPAPTGRSPAPDTAAPPPDAAPAPDTGARPAEPEPAQTQPLPVPPAPEDRAAPPAVTIPEPSSSRDPSPPRSPAERFPEERPTAPLQPPATEPQRVHQPDEDDLRSFPPPDGPPRRG